MCVCVGACVCGCVCVSTDGRLELHQFDPGENLRVCVCACVCVRVCVCVGGCVRVCVCQPMAGLNSTSLIPAAEGGRHTTTDGTAHPRARFTPTARPSVRPSARTAAVVVCPRRPRRAPIENAALRSEQQQTARRTRARGSPPRPVRPSVRPLALRRSWCVHAARAERRSERRFAK